MPIAWRDIRPSLRRVRNSPLVLQGAKTLVGIGFRIVNVTTNLGFAILSARLVGANELGEYISLMTLSGLAAVGLSFGLPTMLGREIAIARGLGQSSNVREVIDWCVWSSLLILFIALAYGIFVASEGLLVGLFILSGQTASLLGAVYAGRERVLFNAVTNDVVRPLFALLALIVMTQWGEAKSATLFVAQIAAASVSMLIYVIGFGVGAVRTTVRNFRIGTTMSKQHVRFLRSGVVLAGGQLLINATTQIDILILAAIAGPEDVAHYYAAARAALVVSFFFGVNAMFAEPKITRLLASKETDQAQKLIEQTALSGCGMSVVASLGACLVAPFYLSWYGEAFLAALPSLFVMLVGLVGLSGFGPAQSVLRATRRDVSLLWVTLLSLLLNVALCLLLVPMAGIIGAAFASASQYVVYGALMAIVSFRATSIRADVFRWARWPGRERS